jgi:hypothetical protein
MLLDVDVIFLFLRGVLFILVMVIIDIRTPGLFYCGNIIICHNYFQPIIWLLALILRFPRKSFDSSETGGVS